MMTPSATMHTPTMTLDLLRKRLAVALAKHSLRQIARDCEVSHELIRKLAFGSKLPNLTIESYNKIEKGLTDNGF